uniref:Uncharacterized protein n=1 Tax=Parascaris univalens TaxID=6257 RepID=A0A915ARH0_PARUN
MRSNSTKCMSAFISTLNYLCRVTSLSTGTCLYKKQSYYRVKTIQDITGAVDCYTFPFVVLTGKGRSLRAYRHARSEDSGGENSEGGPTSNFVIDGDLRLSPQL